VETALRNNNMGVWAGGVIQVVEHLLSKYEALNSNPSTAKTKQKTQKIQKNKQHQQNQQKMWVRDEHAATEASMLTHM
jgi:dihydroxyacid dehydratase/phosphogluconate dehydratase